MAAGSSRGRRAGGCPPQRSAGGPHGLHKEQAPVVPSVAAAVAGWLRKSLAFRTQGKVGQYAVGKGQPSGPSTSALPTPLPSRLWREDFP